MSLYDAGDRVIHPATFTMTLKDVLEARGATLDINNNISRITGGDDLGLNHYPIFDEAYRPILNGKIVDHFYNREIGQESDSIFAWALRRKLNEIMPIYNLRYQSTKITFDPLSTVDIHTVTTGSTGQTGTEHATNATNTSGSSASRSVVSETPQTMLSGDEDYASGATDVNGQAVNTGNVTADSNSETNVNVNGDTTMTGYNGLASDLLIRYRQSLINVDLEIIGELETLFMGVFDNGDSYSPYANTPIYGYGPFGYMPWF